MAKGQVSAELIIVIAALLAVAIIFVTMLQRSAEGASKQVGVQSNALMGQIASIGPECDAKGDCPTPYTCDSSQSPPKCIAPQQMP